MANNTNKKFVLDGGDDLQGEFDEVENLGFGEFDLDQGDNENEEPEPFFERIDNENDSKNKNKASEGELDGENHSSQGANTLLSDEFDLMRRLDADDKMLAPIDEVFDKFDEDLSSNKGFDSFLDGQNSTEDEPTTPAENVFAAGEAFADEESPLLQELNQDAFATVPFSEDLFDIKTDLAEWPVEAEKESDQPSLNLDVTSLPTSETPVLSSGEVEPVQEKNETSEESNNFAPSELAKESNEDIFFAPLDHSTETASSEVPFSTGEMQEELIWQNDEKESFHAESVTESFLEESDEDVILLSPDMIFPPENMDTKEKQPETKTNQKLKSTDGFTETNALERLSHEVILNLGKTTLRGKELTQLRVGTVIALNRENDQSVNMEVGGEMIAQGQIVELEDGGMGVRITELLL